MSWLDAFPIGTREELVRETLANASIAIVDDPADELGWSDGFRFDDNGARYKASFRDEVLADLEMTRDGLSPEDAIALVRALCKMPIVADVGGRLSLTDGVRAVQCENGWVHCERMRHVPSKSAPMREIVTQLFALGQALLAGGPPTGPRRPRIEVWRAKVREEAIVFGRGLQRAYAIAPDMTIGAHALEPLARHVDWIVNHATVFPRDDDWRDAFIVGGNRTPIDTFGCRAESATDLDGNVGIARVRGPFACGLYRLMKPDAEVLVLADIDVTRATSVDDKPGRFNSIVRATCDGVEVRVLGEYKFVHELARLLAAVRARQR